MNIFPGLFRERADICVPLVRLFFVEMTRLSIYTVPIFQYLNSGCVKSCHFGGYALKG